MIQAPEISFEEWKQGVIEAIEREKDTVRQGDRFVQKVLHDYYGFSLDDSIDATSYSGSGDRGIDALIITEASEEGMLPEARVIQGKSGDEGSNFSPYQEIRKFLDALQDAINGQDIKPSLNKCASIYHHGGLIRYVIATYDPLSPQQTGEVDDIRAIANARFGEQVIIENSISLRTIYEALPGVEMQSLTVQLRMQGVQPTPKAYVGVASLVDMFHMMDEYATYRNGDIQSIYDFNVRKWLGRRSNLVNKGIADTLEKQPDHFIAFNNGITIICRSFHSEGDMIILDDPFIVNGCQTTMTLYEFMKTKFAGLNERSPQYAQASAAYLEAYLAIKIIADTDSEYRKNITRFSNKQNAIRGRDFLALEDLFTKMKTALKKRGYFLQVQAGEYDALAKSQKEKFELIDVFDAIRFYAAAVYGKPNTAFGRSSEFTPGGDEFDTITKDLIPEDLLVPWLMSQESAVLGYSLGQKRILDPSNEDHTNQTRYFFLFILFRIVNKVLYNKDETDDRQKLYADLLALQRHRASLKADKSKSHPLTELMYKANQSVATYMALAIEEHWYTDRNAFLKSQSLLLPSQITRATSGQLLDRRKLAEECRRIIA